MDNKIEILGIVLGSIQGFILAKSIPKLGNSLFDGRFEYSWKVYLDEYSYVGVLY